MKIHMRIAYKQRPKPQMRWCCTILNIIQGNGLSMSWKREERYTEWRHFDSSGCISCHVLIPKFVIITTIIIIIIILLISSMLFILMKISASSHACQAKTDDETKDFVIDCTQFSSIFKVERSSDGHPLIRGSTDKALISWIDMRWLFLSVTATFKNAWTQFMIESAKDWRWSLWLKLNC